MGAGQGGRDDHDEVVDKILDIGKSLCLLGSHYLYLSVGGERKERNKMKRMFIENTFYYCYLEIGCCPQYH